MRVVDCSSKLLEYDVHKPLEFIEQVGRVCYKSENAIKEGSAENFFNKLVKNGHFAMLEHATFAFEVSANLYTFLTELFKTSGKTNKYTEDDITDGISHLNFTAKFIDHKVRYIVSGNLRALNNVRYSGFYHELIAINHNLCYKPSEYGSGEYCRLISNLFDLPGLTVDEIMYHCHLSFLCTTDRGVTHELVRHREMSFAQESTRYCNYSKGKFGNELTFVKPFFYSEGNLHPSSISTQRWLRSCIEDEMTYFGLLSNDISPQGARSVLPNSLASTIVMTANVKEFIHFFNLRYAGRTGMPHPDMLNLTRKMYSQYTEYFNGKNLSFDVLDQLHV